MSSWISVDAYEASVYSVAAILLMSVGVDATVYPWFQNFTVKRRMKK